MGFVVAIVVAVVAASYEQHSRLNHRVTFEHYPWFWYAARAVIEACFACVTLAVARDLDIRYSDEWYAGFAAWFVGASTARSAAIEPFSRGRTLQVGLQYLFDGLRRRIEDRLDRIGRNADTKYRDQVVPALAGGGVSPEEFGRRLIEQIDGLNTLKPSEREDHIRAARRTIEDEASGNEGRLGSFVLQALSLRLYEWLDDSVAAAGGDPSRTRVQRRWREWRARRVT